MADNLIMQIARDKMHDLQNQADLFGMDVDIERWELVEKDGYIEATWITNWKNKGAGADHNPEDNWDEDAMPVGELK